LVYNFAAVANKSNRICANCGFQGKPKNETKGSIWIELVLWVVFILPGVLYSVWRMTTKQDVCPKCKQPAMIPLDTPKGQELAQKFSKDTK
jgi:hypothetical protein